MYRLRWCLLPLLLLLNLCASGQQDRTPGKLSPAAARQQATLLLHQAAQYIRSASTPGSRAVFLFRVASQAYRAGDHELAAAELQQAVASAEADQATRGTFSVAMTLRMFGENQLKAGDRDGALLCAARIVQIAPGIPEDPRRANVVQRAAALQEEAGDMAAAAQSLASVAPPSGSFSPAVAEMAALRVKQNDLAGAKALAAGKPDHHASMVLQSIVEAQLDAGDLAGAAETANSMPHPGIKATTIAKIAEARGRAGDVSGASADFARALAIEGQPGQPIALYDVAMAKARLGDFTGAVDLLSTGTNHDFGPKAMDLAQVALLASKAGKAGVARDAFARAIASAKQQSNVDGSRRDLEQIAIAQAQAGEYADAKSTVEMLPVELRPNVIEQVAIEQANRGDVGEAEASLAELGSRRRPLGQIAVAKARKGDFTGASLAASNVINFHRDVLREQARQGDVAGALAESVRPKDPLQRADLLTGIAEGLLDAADAAEKEAQKSTAPKAQ